MHLRLLILVGLFSLAVAPSTFAQRNLKDVPDPDPELERKSFIVQEGFEVNLYAGDPLLAKPIQMNFDERGRLWIASSSVYPQIKPGQVAEDKILVLEDTNNDGQADKTTVFADGLLIPTGVVPGDGGAYVANSTELIHLSDTDGDGRADRRRVVLSGFGTEDTHHLLHTLRWGHDGQLYMNQSIYIHSHVETPYGVMRLNGGGIWRFRPENLKLDVLCYGFVNPWGHHFDRWGQSFATDGAYGEGINYVFPGSVFVTAPGAKRLVKGLNPGSPKHCGLEILSGRHLPEDWAGSMITNDFRAHRVCRFVVTEAGSGYASRQEQELIKTTHVAFRPIDVKVGPDGAIYIADWYNPIIQHGEVDFRDPRRDHVHGRIWRVTAKGRPLVEAPKLADASVEELLDSLKLPEEFTRLHAKLLLKARGPAAVLPALEKWLAALEPQDEQFEHDRLEGLWVYQNLDVVNQKLLEEVLRSPDHRARAAAVRVASQWQDRLPQAAQYYRRGAVDEHPRVRLEAVRALALVPSPQAAEWAMAALDHSMDEFLDFALWQTMRDLQVHWLPALREGRLNFGGDAAKLTFALRAVDSPGVVAPLLKLAREGQIVPERLSGVLALVATLGKPDELRQAVDYLLSPEGKLSEEQQAAVLAAMVEASQANKTRPAGDLAPLTKLLGSPREELQAAVARAAGVWQIVAVRPQLTAWATGETNASPALRQASIEALAQLGGAESVQTLNQLASDQHSFDVRRRAVTALAALAPKEAAQRTVELLASLPEDEDPQPLIAALAARQNGPPALVEALANQKLSADTAKLALRAVRAAGRPLPELEQAVQQAGNLSEAGWKLSPEERQQLAADVLQHGDPARGEAIYRREALQCMKCHAIGGAGGTVGPDIVSLGATAPVDYLIESLLEPNAKVKENFHAVLVATDEGKVIAGIPVRQSETELVLRDAEDRQIVIPADAIEEKRESRSLMPDGLVDTLTRQELIDLTRFLSELGKVGPYAIGQERVARRWQTLAWTQEAHQRLNRTSYDTAATADPALTWTPAYSRVSGELPVEELPRFVVHRDLDPASFVRCEVEAASAGNVQLAFNSVEGLSLWLDGKPTALRPQTTVNLAPGRHTLTLAINREERQTPLRLELTDAAGSTAQANFTAGK